MKYMVEEEKIPSREELHRRLKNQIVGTSRLVDIIEEKEYSEEQISHEDLPIGNFYAHDIVASYPEAAAYFPEDLAQKSASLWKEWLGLVDFCERIAYYDNREVQERRFPWFEGMDLNQNLGKTLTIEQMAEYGAKSTYMPDWSRDRINIAAMGEVAKHVQSSSLYSRKKTIEEMMITHLETPKLK